MPSIETPETPETYTKTPETAIGKDQKDSETAKANQRWPLVAGMG
jgi:hypothetical protein